jgi:hypothetical protein
MKLIRQSNISQMPPALEARGRQYLQNLASAKSHHLDNPQGTELVCILGSGYQEDNRQTLEIWVTNQRHEASEKRMEGYRPLNF